MQKKKSKFNKNEPLTEIGKKRLKEYLIKTGQVIEKSKKNEPTGKHLSEFGRKKLGEFLRKTGQLKD